MRVGGRIFSEVVLWALRHFYVPPGMTGGTLCFRVVHLSVRPSFRPSFCPSRFRRTTLLAVPSKYYAFSTNYHACIAMPTRPRCAPPILFWSWPPYNLFPRSCLTWIFFIDPHWWVPICLQRPAKAMPFQQIIMHALQCQHDIECAPPVLFWPWPPYNLLPRSCFTWIFFVDPHWWVPLCVQCPAKAMCMPFKQIIMHALQCQHDVDVHLLFCFDLDLHITSCWGHV